MKKFFTYSRIYSFSGEEKLWEPLTFLFLECTLFVSVDTWCLTILFICCTLFVSVDTWWLTILFSCCTLFVSVDTWCFFERLRSLLEVEASLWRFLEDELSRWRFLSPVGGVRVRLCGSQSRPGVTILGLLMSPCGVVSLLGVEVFRLLGGDTWRGDTWSDDTWRGGLGDLAGWAAASFCSPLTRFLSTCMEADIGMLFDRTACDRNTCPFSFCAAEPAVVVVVVWDASGIRP